MTDSEGVANSPIGVQGILPKLGCPGYGSSGIQVQCEAGIINNKDQGSLCFRDQCSCDDVGFIFRNVCLLAIIASTLPTSQDSGRRHSGNSDPPSLAQKKCGTPAS